VTHQGSPPGRLTRRAEGDQHGRGGPDRSRRPEQPGWQRDAFGPEDTGADLPSWAGPSSYPVRSGRPAHSHAGGPAGEAGAAADADDARPEPTGARAANRRYGRAAATRLRKSRRRVFRLCGLAIVVCVIGAVIAVFATRSTPARQPYVTTLQPGEFTTVPNACTSVSAAVLAQYLPGTGRTMTSQFSLSTQSQCSFTIDAKPIFRLLEVGAQAYQPFAAASGNGSASDNARDNLTLTRSTLAAPPKKSPLSPAQITPLAKLGQQAFMAYQRETAGNITSDVVTVLVLERNVLITVELSAQQSPGFSPAPVATLEAGAIAAARNVLARVLTQPTA